MTDAEFEVQKQRLKALSEKWIKPLGLAWWHIELAYAREEYQPLGETSKEDSLAHCKADWRYGDATITWNMPEVAEQSDEWLETAFIHELCHIFLHEMRWGRIGQEDNLDHEERVATTLTKAFLWLRDSLVKED